MLSDKFTVSFISAEATVVWLGLQLVVVYYQVISDANQTSCVTMT
jgi:hypothetical protein